jgi:hypothetical protein
VYINPHRLAEANLQGITKEVYQLYQAEGRRLVSEAVSLGLLQAVSEGPRATEAFAAVSAVFVSGLSALAKAQDVAARFLEMAAQLLEKVGLWRGRGLVV